MDSKCVSTWKNFPTYTLPYGGKARAYIKKNAALYSEWVTIPEGASITGKTICHCNSAQTLLYVNGVQVTGAYSGSDKATCDHRLIIDNASND